MAMSQQQLSQQTGFKQIKHGSAPTATVSVDEFQTAMLPEAAIAAIYNGFTPVMKEIKIEVQTTINCSIYGWKSMFCLELYVQYSSIRAENMLRIPL